MHVRPSSADGDTSPPSTDGSPRVPNPPTGLSKGSRGMRGTCRSSGCPLQPFQAPDETCADVTISGGRQRRVLSTYERTKRVVTFGEDNDVGAPNLFCEEYYFTRARNEKVVLIRSHKVGCLVKFGFVIINLTISRSQRVTSL